jgi:hypothetical protein
VGVVRLLIRVEIVEVILESFNDFGSLKWVLATIALKWKSTIF